MTLRTLLILAPLLVLCGCWSRPSIAVIAPPDAATATMDVEKPGTAAEQDVVTKKESAEKARASGDVMATLEAERSLAASRARLAREQVKQWEQAAKDKDNEIREEKDRKRQAFLYWFSGICGFLALLATAGAILWPTTRVITRPAALLLGGLVPLSLFAAWLVPYLPYVAMGSGVAILLAGGWYLSRNERSHQLKDKATGQLTKAVDEAKDSIPEFASSYKQIFRGQIDSDADALLNAKRRELAHLEADEEARVSKARAA